MTAVFVASSVAVAVIVPILTFVAPLDNTFMRWIITYEYTVTGGEPVFISTSS
jgi:hypothetical protein